MSVPEALLWVLVRLPKLFISIAKQYSSTPLHLLRYLSSFWNSFIPKQKRKQLPENDADTGLTQTVCVNSVEDSQKEDTSTRSATIMYTRGGDSVLGRTPTLLGFNTPTAGPSGEGDRRVANPSTTPPKGYQVIRTPTTHQRQQGRMGFIERSLKATQHHRETNIDEWKKFWMMFQQDVSNINLLATVLLAGNANFLNITATDGLSYWPQKLSYASLVAALGSILVGLAVRNPRIFTAHSSFYFQTMLLVLGFPFELFLYSTILFIAALIVHLAIHLAKDQIYAAVTIMGLVIVSLFFHWLITEPLDGWQFSPQKCKTQRVEGNSQTV